MRGIFLSVTLFQCLSLMAAPAMRCECDARTTAGGLVLDRLGEAREFGWRRYAYNADAGLIEPGGRYRVSFRCKVEGRDAGAFLLVLVRPLNWSGNEKDVLALSVDPTKARKAERLDLAKGVYRLNTDAPLMLDDYGDFTFDGHGSTFVSYRHQGAFLRLRRCERMRLMNFSVDWDWSREPLASLVKVMRTDAASFDLQFVDYTDFPHKKAMLTILSTPGHAFVLGGRQHHTLFDHVNIIAPKDDPKRVITCTADHLHIAQSRGFIKLESCEFSLGADDIMNMHDSTAFARKTGPRTVRSQNAWVMATARKGDRIELRNGDYSPTGFFGTFVSAKRVAEGRNDFDVTFAEEVPDETQDGFVLFNWAFDTHNVIVRNCRFHDNRARGFLILARDVTVENNVFRHHEMGAIKIETGYTHNLWSEGYGVSNVVIRGNVFDNTNPSGSYGGHRERTIYAGIYLKTDPSTDTTDYPILRDILIARNRFRDNCGVTAYLSSVRNVTVCQNLIEDPTPRRQEKPYRSQFS